MDGWTGWMDGQTDVAEYGDPAPLQLPHEPSRAHGEPNYGFKLSFD